MFTNKHVVVAMLVAPVLAILAWFAIDYFLAERPQAAQPGASYKLIAKSNCRYDSGQCGDFKLTLQPIEIENAVITLGMKSHFPLQQATLGFINDNPQPVASKMTSTTSEATEWSATLAVPSGDASTLGIAVTSGGASYFAEIPTTFLELNR